MLTVLLWHVLYLALIAVAGLVVVFVCASWSRMRYEVNQWKKRQC